MAKLGEHWLSDPRLPDAETSGERIYGNKRPTVPPPGNARTVAMCTVTHGKVKMRLKVDSNRKGSRYWFTASYGDKPRKDDPMAHFPSHRPDEHGLIYTYMRDYDSTTSKTKAQGWIDAVNKACTKRRSR